MFLKTLTISSFGSIIREIRFRPGLNLIVDETNSVDGRETGNNVGKTSVLMLIDFCLGGDGKKIYIDPENKKVEYKLVKDFLISKQVIISLVIKEDLNIAGSQEVLIERNFLPKKGKEKILRIGNKEKTEEEFEESLMNLLVPGHYPKKPTFRQIVSHNIRYKDLSITNTLKTLDAYTRGDEYETLYLFLFGCQNEQGDAKQDLKTQIRLEENFKKRLENQQTLSGYEAALTILENEITLLEERKNKFNLNPNFSADLDKLNQIRYEMNYLAGDISKLEMRRNLIIEAQKELRSDISNVDEKQLYMIYQQAKAQVDGIQKTFSELQRFHNQMIEEKIRYISQYLPSIDNEISNKRIRLQVLVQDESVRSAEIAKGDLFADLEKIIADLNDKYRRKGNFENTISQLREVESNLKNYNDRLDEIDESLFSNETEKLIKDQVDKFNKHFAAISQELYNEQYALKVDTKVDKRGQRVYEFSVFQTNMSSGKKQGEISCFDIAYTLFADQENIPCMHFLLNDKKELMHDNQLIKISSLVNQKGVQFIASILRDKLPPELNQDRFVVLKLAQDDKLFKIENSV